MFCFAFLAKETIEPRLLLARNDKYLFEVGTRDPAKILPTAFHKNTDGYAKFCAGSGDTTGYRHCERERSNLGIIVPI